MFVIRVLIVEMVYDVIRYFIILEIVVDCFIRNN